MLISRINSENEQIKHYLSKLGVSSAAESVLVRDNTISFFIPQRSNTTRIEEALSILNSKIDKYWNKAEFLVVLDNTEIEVADSFTELRFNGKTYPMNDQSQREIVRDNYNLCLSKVQKDLGDEFNKTIVWYIDHQNAEILFERTQDLKFDENHHISCKIPLVPDTRISFTWDGKLWRKVDEPFLDTSSAEIFLDTEIILVLIASLRSFENCKIKETKERLDKFTQGLRLLNVGLGQSKVEYNDALGEIMFKSTSETGKEMITFESLVRGCSLL